MKTLNDIVTSRNEEVQAVMLIQDRVSELYDHLGLQTDELEDVLFTEISGIMVDPATRSDVMPLFKQMHNLDDATQTKLMKITVDLTRTLKVVKDAADIFQQLNKTITKMQKETVTGKRKREGPDTEEDKRVKKRARRPTRLNLIPDEGTPPLMKKVEEVKLEPQPASERQLVEGHF